MKPKDKKTLQPCLYHFKVKDSPSNFNANNSIGGNNSFTPSSSSEIMQMNKKIVHQSAPHSLVLSHRFKNTIYNPERGEDSDYQRNTDTTMTVLSYPSTSYPVKGYNKYIDR